jgi:hypothetical protein
MWTLSFSVGRDVHGRVGDDQRVLVVGNVHDEAVADPPRGAKAGLPRNHRRHQLVGVEAALHQRFGPAARTSSPP